MPADLAAMVDGSCARAALGALGLARKAGPLLLGATKVEAGVRSGAALARAACASRRPRRRAQDHAGKARDRRGGGPEIAAYKLFSEAELGLALGGKM